MSSEKAQRSTAVYALTTSLTFADTCEEGRGYTRGVSTPISGQRIVELRRQAGFATQQALAEAAGMDGSKLSRIENNKPVNLTLKTIERLAVALKVPVRELFTEPRPEQGGGRESGASASGGEGLADSLRRAIADYEATGQFPGDWRGDIMLAIFALTRALQRPTAAAEPEGQAKQAHR